MTNDKHVADQALAPLSRFPSPALETATGSSGTFCEGCGSIGGVEAAAVVLTGGGGGGGGVGGGRFLAGLGFGVGGFGDTRLPG